jgi:hypothetical protein
VGVRRAWLGGDDGGEAGLNRERWKKTDKDSDDAVSGKRRGGRWVGPTRGKRSKQRRRLARVRLDV